MADRTNTPPARSSDSYHGPVSDHQVQRLNSNMVAGPLRSRVPPPSHDVPDLAALAAQARQLYPRQAQPDDDRTLHPPHL